MATFYAQPYCITLCGFYFDSERDYEQKLEHAKRTQDNEDFEHEVQFIDGFDCELELFKNVGECVWKFWEYEDTEIKGHAIEYLVNWANYSFEEALEKQDSVQVYEGKKEHWAYDIAQEIYGLQGFALDYFDCESYCRDHAANGLLVELETDVYVTNAGLV